MKGSGVSGEMKEGMVEILGERERRRRGKLLEERERDRGDGLFSRHLVVDIVISLEVTRSPRD